MNKDLTEGKPESVLWRFCMPILGSVIFQQLYNIADSLIVGRFTGEEALAAVGNSYEITLIYLAFAFGCNMGCSVIAAGYYGAKAYTKMRTTIYTTFIMTGVLCAVLMLCGFLFGGELLHIINTPDKIFAPSKLYLDIYTAGLLFLFFYNVATGIFTALGDSKTPFVFLAVSSVANVIVDILFVKGFDMGVAGVAWATFICQGLSCVCAMYVVLRRLAGMKKMEMGEKANVFSGPIFFSIIKIAIPSTLQQSFISVGNIMIQGIINGFGHSVMAGYAAAIKLNNMVITTFSALGNGISNFTAQNVGAAKTARIRKGHSAGLKLAYAFAIPMVLLYLIKGDFFVRLFLDTKTGQALDAGVQFLQIVAPFYLVICIKLVSDGVLRGTGSMREFMIATFTDLILRVGLAAGLSKIFDEVGIWMSWPLGWIVGAGLSFMFYVKIRNKLEKTIS